MKEYSFYDSDYNNRDSRGIPSLKKVTIGATHVSPPYTTTFGGEKETTMYVKTPNNPYWKYVETVTVKLKDGKWYLVDGNDDRSASYFRNHEGIPIIESSLVESSRIKAREFFGVSVPE